MQIAYSSRSKFFDPIEQRIQVEDNALRTGQTVTVDLEPGGYNRRVRITINADDKSGFDTDWSGSDPTRFSARIRAAATVLLNSGYIGAFDVVHDDGILEIRRV